jgi:hypothetical protein
VRNVVAGTVCVLALLAVGVGVTAAIKREPTPRPGFEDVVRGGDATASDCRPRDDAHLLVFLAQDATDAHLRAIEAVLAASEHVASFGFCDADESRAEAREMFRDDPEVLAKVESGGVHVPTSYRVLLTEPDTADAVAVLREFVDHAGVQRAIATDLVECEDPSDLGDTAEWAAAERRGPHVIAFLVEGASEADRQAIEAVLDADERVASYEYVDGQRSLAEVRRLFRCHPPMLARIEEGRPVPESYRVSLHDPGGSDKDAMRDDMAALPGVLEADILGEVRTGHAA